MTQIETDDESWREKYRPPVLHDAREYVPLPGWMPWQTVARQTRDDEPDDKGPTWPRSCPTRTG